jgi:hypothetical protein
MLTPVREMEVDIDLQQFINGKFSQGGNPPNILVSPLTESCGNRLAVVSGNAWDMKPHSREMFHLRFETQ